MEGSYTVSANLRGPSFTETAVLQFSQKVNGYFSFIQICGGLNFNQGFNDIFQHQWYTVQAI